MGRLKLFKLVAGHLISQVISQVPTRVTDSCLQISLASFQGILYMYNTGPKAFRGPACTHTAVAMGGGGDCLQRSV